MKVGVTSEKVLTLTKNFNNPCFEPSIPNLSSFLVLPTSIQKEAKKIYGKEKENKTKHSLFVSIHIYNMRKTLLILILVNIVTYKVQTASKYNNTIENTSDPMSSKPLKKR